MVIPRLEIHTLGARPTSSRWRSVVIAGGARAGSARRQFRARHTRNRPPHSGPSGISADAGQPDNTWRDTGTISGDDGELGHVADCAADNASRKTPDTGALRLTATGPNMAYVWAVTCHRSPLTLSLIEIDRRFERHWGDRHGHELLRSRIILAARLCWNADQRPNHSWNCCSAAE